MDLDFIPSHYLVVDKDGRVMSGGEIPSQKFMLGIEQQYGKLCNIYKFKNYEDYNAVKLELELVIKDDQA